MAIRQLLKRRSSIVIIITIVLVGFLFRKPIVEFAVLPITVKIENFFKSEKTIYHDNRTIYETKTEQQKISNEEAEIKIKRIFGDAIKWGKNERKNFKEDQKNTAEEYSRRMGVQQPLHAHAQLKLLNKFIKSLDNRLSETNQPMEDVALKTSRGIKYLDTSWIKIEKQSITNTYKETIEKEKMESRESYPRFGGRGNFEEELNKIGD